MNFGMIILNQSTKYKDKAKLCYMDTDSFIIHIITEDIANDVEKWFDISNYDKNDNRLLLIGWNEKEISLFKDELGRKIMKEFVGLRAKTYLMNDDSEHKRAKRTKKCVMKRELMFENYTDCLFNDKTILKSQQRFKCHCHDVHTEQINKIALSSNDDKRLQTFDKTATYPYGISTLEVSESEMPSKI